MKRLFRILCPLIFAFFVCSSAFCAVKKLAAKDIVIRKADGTEVVVNAEIAVKQDDMIRGFMERKVIPDGTGMLFVYSRDQILNFWMKNTPHPLSIAYIDYSGKIRDIFDMTPYSLANVTSTVSVRYALEVPQGWFEKVGVKKGDKVLLEDVLK